MGTTSSAPYQPIPKCDSDDKETALLRKEVAQQKAVIAELRAQTGARRKATRKKHTSIDRATPQFPTPEKEDESKVDSRRLLVSERSQRSSGAPSPSGGHLPQHLPCESTEGISWHGRPYSSEFSRKDMARNCEKLTIVPTLPPNGDCVHHQSLRKQDTRYPRIDGRGIHEPLKSTVTSSLLFPLHAAVPIALDSAYAANSQSESADATDATMRPFTTSIVPETVKDQHWFTRAATEHFRQSHWTLDLSGSDMQYVLKTPRGVQTFAMIGDFGVGKTWLTRRLTCNTGETVGPEGATVHTDGLHCKIGNFHGKRIVAIDSKGYNSPLISHASAVRFSQSGGGHGELAFRLRLLSRQDKFEQDLAVALAGIIFVVVNQITRANIERIQEIRQGLGAASPGRHQPELIVAHNLKHIRSPEELVAVWHEVDHAVMAGGCGQRPTLQELQPSKMCDIKPIRMHLAKGPLAARHFFFVGEEMQTDWGHHYNEASLRELRRTVDKMCPDDTVNIFSDMSRMETQISTVVQSHFRNCCGIRFQPVNESDNRVFRIIPNISDLHRTFGISNFDKNAAFGEGEEFPVKANIYYSKRAHEQFFVIDLALPGAIVHATGQCPPEVPPDEVTTFNIVKCGKLFKLIVKGVLPCCPFRSDPDCHAVTEILEELLPRGHFVRHFKLPCNVRPKTMRISITSNQLVRVQFHLLSSED